MYMSIILEQQEVIDRLAAHNKHLIYLLAQYTEVENEEQRLTEILRDTDTTKGQNNGLDS